MIQGVRLALPSRMGLDFGDPEVVDYYWASAEKAIQSALDAICKDANDPRKIVIEGKSLDNRALGADMIPSEIRMLDTTLSEARREAAKRGCGVCDGQGGRPDMRHKFIKAAGPGEDAGESGAGGYTASTSVTIPDHSLPSHVHPNGTLGVCVAACTCGSDVNGTGATAVALATHTHTACVTGQMTAAGAATFVHITTATTTVSGGPAFYELILIKRMR